MRALSQFLGAALIGFSVSLAAAQTPRPTPVQPSDAAAAAQSPGSGSPRALGRPIVNGRRLQPTPETDAQGAGGKNLPSGQASEVDEIYNQLIKGPTSREEIAGQCKATHSC